MSEDQPHLLKGRGNGFLQRQPCAEAGPNSPPSPHDSAPLEARPPRVCDECGGDRGWEVVDGPDRERGGAITHWSECRACDGRGEVEDDSRPITMEDLAAIEGDDSDPYGAFAYRGGNP